MFPGIPSQRQELLVDVLIYSLISVWRCIQNYAFSAFLILNNLTSWRNPTPSRLSASLTNEGRLSKSFMPELWLLTWQSPTSLGWRIVKHPGNVKIISAVVIDVRCDHRRRNENSNMGPQLHSRTKRKKDINGKTNKVCTLVNSTGPRSIPCFWALKCRCVRWEH